MAVARIRARNITAEERRQQALELLKDGFTQRQIGTQLGVSRQAVGKMLKRGLAELREENNELLAGLRTLHRERIQTLLRVVWPKVLRGDKEAVVVALQVMRRQAEFDGLDAPTQLEVIPPEPPVGIDPSLLTTEELIFLDRILQRQQRKVSSGKSMSAKPIASSDP